MVPSRTDNGLHFWWTIALNNARRRQIGFGGGKLESFFRLGVSVCCAFWNLGFARLYWVIFSSQFFKFESLRCVSFYEIEIEERRKIFYSHSIILVPTSVILFFIFISGPFVCHPFMPIRILAHCTTRRVLKYQTMSGCAHVMIEAQLEGICYKNQITGNNKAPIWYLIFKRGKSDVCAH